MTGEVVRFRTLTDVSRKHSRKECRSAGCLHSSTLKAKPGKHLLAVLIASIPEGMEIDRAFLDARMKFLGWVPDTEDDPIPGPILT